jgi:hypothetical protein
MKSLTTNGLRDLTIDEIDTVSGAKGKKEIVGVIVERCESRYQGGKKISVCTPVN